MKNAYHSKGKAHSRDEKVYCQICGSNLNGSAVFVSNTKEIYCPAYKNGVDKTCVVQAMDKGGSDDPVSANFYNAQDVQKAIKNKEITHFGKLEKKLVKNLNISRAS